jgi:hypothetical protein
VSGHRREFHFRHLNDRPHAVYIVWSGDNGDVPLYVGMTSDWLSRTRHHERRYGDAVTHIDVWHAAGSRTEAEELERDTIHALAPRDNYVHTERDEFRSRRAS